MKNIRAKGIVSIILLLLIMSSCENHTALDKSKSVFFIVQPAEHFQALNGHLNSKGRERSGDLMRFLKDSSIARIYTAAFAYSWETTDSLKRLQNIKSVEYPGDSISYYIFHLLKKNEDFGRRVLIVSAPENINAIAEKLGKPASRKLHPEGKLNKIYRLENNKGKTTFKILKYGD